MPEVSVLIPIFNVESYLEETIQSVLNQTFQDFELILVDDGSTDSSAYIASKYCSLDIRVKLISCERNLGISKALNYGLSACRGKYIARVDGDDLMARERLERQYAYLEENLDYGLVGCWVKNIDESGVPIGSCRYPICHEMSMEVIWYTSPVLHIWMARRALYRELEGYRLTNPAEDYDFLLRAVNKGYRIGNIPYYGAFIRLRNGNTMTFAALKQRKAFNYLKKKFKNNEIELGQFDFSNAELLSSRGLRDKVVENLHSLSIYFLRAGLSTKNPIKRYVCFSMALISPYTIQDVYRRQMFKKIIAREGLRG